MKPLWRDRYVQDNYGQPICTQHALLAPLRDALSSLRRVEHWAIKALFTTALSIVAAFFTARATKQEDPTQVRDIKELHARVSLLESRLKLLEVEASKPVGINANHDRVAGAQNQATLNGQANQQPASKP
ncbi:hypothetical protein WI91_09120 [Burkholderia vietnamiensis]|nr:hypothetical protein WI91_09120 [Burkholderia vietnamiensis]KVE80376.1 hypothetical protein WJ00_02315 [Burkholderia vietnamiensis]